MNNATQIISTTGNGQTNGQTNEAFLAQFKADTGWDYSDAVEMAVERRTENRLFGNRSSQCGNRVVRVRETAEQKFERETGWTFGDAVDMAAETQRDNRLFGGHRLN